ncbi:MAG: hypothetical protein J7M40_18115 [Planctomycetes bacterium]|nr:hypothetical protein [Planctomycetota bacterium]
MKKIRVCFLILAAAITLIGCRKSQPNASEQTARTPKTENKTPAQPGGAIDLKVLYAGRPGSDREKDFVAFLSKHFTQVTTGDLAELNDAGAEAFDVVIFDYDGKSSDAPMPDISDDYSAPTITLGVVGANISSELGLATGYM